MSGIDAAQPWHDTDRVYPGLQTWDVFTGELHAWRLRDADAKPPSDHRDGDLILAQRLSELEARVDQLLAKKNAPAATPPLSMMTSDHWLPCGTQRTGLRHVDSSYFAASLPEGWHSVDLGDEPRTAARCAGVHHTLWPTYRDGTDPFD